MQGIFEKPHKDISRERFLELSKEKFSTQFVMRGSTYNGDFFYIRNLDFEIGMMSREILSLYNRIEDEKDYIEFLENDMIIVLEEDKDSLILYGTNKLHKSFWYEEYEKESKKLIKNTKARISRLNEKLQLTKTKHEAYKKFQRIFDKEVELKS